MKKFKNRKSRRKNILIIAIIFALIFTASICKLADKWDTSLAEAYNVLDLNEIDIDQEVENGNHDTNQEQLNNKIEANDETGPDDEIEINEKIEANNDKIEEKEQKSNIEEYGNKDDENKDDKVDEIIKEEKEETEKMVDVNKDIIEEDQKIAYITFDDGPSSKVTSQILDILSGYDIKATFFVVGKSVEDNPEILKRIHEEEHAIGNHTYSHNYEYIYKSISNFTEEIEHTEEILKNILGEEFETDLFRFPGGSFEDWKRPFREYVVELGYRYIDWNSLNGDAEGKNLSKEQLINRFKSTYKNQKKLIILMHDTDAKPSTPEALPEIIDFLIEKGYKFATF